MSPVTHRFRIHLTGRNIVQIIRRKIKKMNNKHWFHLILANLVRATE